MSYNGPRRPIHNLQQASISVLYNVANKSDRYISKTQTKKMHTNNTMKCTIYTRTTGQERGSKNFKLHVCNFRYAYRVTEGRCSVSQSSMEHSILTHWRHLVHFLLRCLLLTTLDDVSVVIRKFPYRLSRLGTTSPKSTSQPRGHEYHRQTFRSTQCWHTQRENDCLVNCVPCPIVCFQFRHLIKCIKLTHYGLIASTYYNSEI